MDCYSFPVGALSSPTTCRFNPALQGHPYPFLQLLEPGSKNNPACASHVRQALDVPFVFEIPI